MPALHTITQRQRHIVAQVVEAEFVVSAIGDVGLVRGPSGGRIHVGQDRPHLQAQKMVDPAHLLRLELSQVVVDSDDVHAFAGERVEIARQHRDEGLALAGLHLGDLALVQGGATHDLDVEVSLVQDPLGSFPYGGEGLRQQRVQRLAVVVALPEISGLPLQLIVRHRLVVILDRVDLLRDRLQLLQLAAFADVQHPVEQTHVRNSSSPSPPSARSGPS